MRPMILILAAILGVSPIWGKPTVPQYPKNVKDATIASDHQRQSKLVREFVFSIARSNSIGVLKTVSDPKSLADYANVLCKMDTGWHYIAQQLVVNYDKEVIIDTPVQYIGDKLGLLFTSTGYLLSHDDDKPKSGEYAYVRLLPRKYDNPSWQNIPDGMKKVGIFVSMIRVNDDWKIDLLNTDMTLLFYSTDVMKSAIEFSDPVKFGVVDNDQKNPEHNRWMPIYPWDKPK